MAATLSYQEILRTLGNLLCLAPDEDVTIRLSAEGAEVTTATGRQSWDVEALQAEVARQRGGRLRPQLYGKRSGHICGRLRPVGAELDARGGESYTVITAPGAVHVHGASGYEQTYQPVPLEQRVSTAAHLRQEFAPAPPPGA